VKDESVFVFRAAERVAEIEPVILTRAAVDPEGAVATGAAGFVAHMKSVDPGSGDARGFSRRNPVERRLVTGCVVHAISTAAHGIVVVAVFHIRSIADDAVVAGVPAVRMREAEIVAEFMHENRQPVISIGNVDADPADVGQPGVSGRGTAAREDGRKGIIRKRESRSCRSIAGVRIQPGKPGIIVIGRRFAHGERGCDLRPAGTEGSDADAAPRESVHVSNELVHEGCGAGIADRIG
jgi:hypothetical protein